MDCEFDKLTPAEQEEHHRLYILSEKRKRLRRIQKARKEAENETDKIQSVARSQQKV
jgi:CHASE3 domain sensor protein